MRTVSFQEVRDELINNMRRKMLIPVIGSGFTRDCQAYKGIVPSGKDYREYMISQIINTLNLSVKDIENLKNDSFSNISGIYQKVVPLEAQRNYLLNNFTHVCIDDNKKDFLSPIWPYIYTLNIDDGIEKNSAYNFVVYSNRPVEDNIFDNLHCVVKLHGDVSDILSYKDSQSEIFTQEQYVNSLESNKSLLIRLNHDSIFQNLIFLGCSLDDEIDLLEYLKSDQNQDNVTAKYICLVEEPSILDKYKYEKYGITHCIIFNSYDDIYRNLYNAGIEAQKISVNDLDHYKSFSIEHLSTDYDANKSYLLFGKSLINKDHKITLPYFFISREVANKIITSMSEYSVQFLVGGGYSGKSYVLTDIASRIKDRDVFFFQTKDRLTESAFKQLFQKKNCVIIADNTALSTSQVEFYLKSLQKLKDNNTNIIIAIDKNNRELNGIFKLYEIQKIIRESDYPQIPVSSKLNSMEIEQINPLLTAIDAGIFDIKKTLVDNIIYIGENLDEKSKYHNTIPKLQSVRELAALISLAIERKIYSKRAVKLDLYDELLLQCKTTEPLISYESTWSFETNLSDNSPTKYVVNAEYWLCCQLGLFANNKSNYKTIVEAYKYIIAKIIEQEGRFDLLSGYKDVSYKQYILFDNINRIFYSNKTSGRNRLSLIREIYEGLNELLSIDPNYMHQRAKCYIRSAYFENSAVKKNKYLDKAYRDANVAYQLFKHRFDECRNKKLLISIAHVTYTQALVWCHRCNINEYKDVNQNTHAINLLYEALSSPYNSYDYAKNDSFNYYNVIDKIIQETIANKDLVNCDIYHILEELFESISNN